jgi:hypothetical protein
MDWMKALSEQQELPPDQKGKEVASARVDDNATIDLDCNSPSLEHHTTQTARQQGLRMYGEFVNEIFELHKASGRGTPQPCTVEMIAASQ